MKRLLPFLLVSGACVPDIPQNPPPGPSVVVQFDLAAKPRALLPVPNDVARSPLTGKIAIPPSTSDTPAQAEFNATYLNTLTGFPYESPIQVGFSGPLDPMTVTKPQSVLVVDTTAMTPVPLLARTLDASGTSITIAPPAGGWTRAHRYAVALVSGSAGLQGAHGEPVIGSPTWALVSSPNKLVDCPGDDLKSPPEQCKLLVDVIPSSATDPRTRLDEQTTNAILLEAIRRGYAPLLARIESLEGFSDASNIPMLWTFTIVDAGEMTFDPANGIIPFPNDLLLTNGKVALPSPGMQPTLQQCAAAVDTATQLYCGLDLLDGFSTTAPPISENGDATGAVAQANFDPSTLAKQGAGLIPLGFTSPAQEQAPLEYTPCINCLSSADSNGQPQTSPQQLQWRLDAPLDEKTTYLAYVTGDLKDDQRKGVIANPVFALVRLKNPLFANMKSQVSILGDADAAKLEVLRAALAPALDQLEGAGVPRTNVALAWAFTTQSEATLLDQLHAFGSQTLPTQGIFIFADQTTQYSLAAAAAGIPVDAISKFYFGVFMTPFAVTGPGGTLDPSHFQPRPVTFTLAVPDPAQVVQPMTGYAVTIFGHGLTRDRNDFLGLANSLAKFGQATIATDAPYHGERSSCTGAGAYLSQVLGMNVSDDAACADPVKMKCNEDPVVGRCVARDDTTRIPCPGLGVPGPDMTGNVVCLARHLGACAADGKCEGGDFARDAGGRPLISGWNIISLTNFFQTRDHFRQQVIDLAQLVHVLHATPLEMRVGGTFKFDLGRLGYVGQSLGGILGTLFNAVSPETTNVALNVPGGDLVQIILNSPSFVAQKQALLAGLKNQSPPLVPGTPAFDQFIGIAQWIVDPADPANYGWRLTHSSPVPNGVAAPNASRKAFIQFIEGDQTVPNFSNMALVAAADRPLANTPPSFGCKAPLYCYEFTEAGSIPFTMATVPLSGRHGFLLQPPASPMQSPTMQALLLTSTAQAQVATFLSTGSLP